jgi:putative transcriptional regulator
MAIKRKSRILQEVHEMASDLHEIGLIDKRRMHEFEALCGLDVQEMTPRRLSSSAKKPISARQSSRLY